MLIRGLLLFVGCFCLYSSPGFGHPDDNRPNPFNQPKPAQTKLSDLGFDVSGDCKDQQWAMDDATRTALRAYGTKVKITTSDVQGKFCSAVVTDKATGEKKFTLSLGYTDSTSPTKLLAELKKNVPLVAVNPQPAGCFKADAESKAWTKKQLDVAAKSFAGKDGGLVDGTVFLSDQGTDILKKHKGKTSTTAGKNFELVSLGNHQSGYKYAIDITQGRTTSRWFVAEQPWYKDQYPNSRPVSDFVIYKDGENKMVQANLSAKALGAGGIDFAEINRAMTTAEENRVSELRDPTQTGKWDLPKGPMGYLGLVDSGYTTDPVIKGLASDVRNFPRMMNEKKGSCVFTGNDGSDFIVVNKSPKEILLEQLRKLADKGLTSAYLNLAGHGNEGGIHFKNPNGGFVSSSFVLSPEDLAEVINSQPKMNIVVNTVACHGGGVAKMMATLDKNIKGDKDRVRVFLQAKVEGVNQEGRIQGTLVNKAPEAYSTYYQVYLSHFLDNGKKYGEAHLLADRAAKTRIPSDAEVWVPGASTKGVR